MLYGELRRIAHARLRHAGSRTLLNTTGLVNEAYLKLAQAGQLEIADRGHFLAYAARAMRSIIIDQARRNQAARRGGAAEQVTLDSAMHAAGDDETVLRVHEALAELAGADPRLAQVVELRYFGGLEHAEIAQALGVGERTVERDWARARIALFSMLR